MASTSAIDTEATGSGLRAANETAENAIGAGTPSNPTGQYVASTSTALTGLLTTALGALGEKVTTGAVATESTVLVFDSTEQANQTSLSI
jgi:hypothetical protein